MPISYKGFAAANPEHQEEVYKHLNVYRAKGPDGKYIYIYI